MDDYVRAVLLGLLQAVTEFAPVSSSGHLVLAAELTGERANALTFDVGLHLGTTAAVIVCFWRDWWVIAVAVWRGVATYGPRIERWEPRAQLGGWIALATVPAVVVGFALDRTIEAELRRAWLVAVLLIVAGVVMGVADARGGSRRGIGDATGSRALWIGVAQALALVPGVSRSGATIAAARALGFDRLSAVRYSFLLSAPAVLGAGALAVVNALRGDEVVEWGPLLAGAAVSGICGLVALRALLRFFERHTLRVFVWYRIALGLAVLLALAAGAR